MATYVKENRHLFRGTGLFFWIIMAKKKDSVFLDNNARRERKLMREEMLKARNKGLHAIIRNNQLLIEGKLISIEDKTTKNRFSMNQDKEDQGNSQDDDNFRSYNNTEYNNKPFQKQRPTI